MEKSIKRDLKLGGSILILGIVFILLGITMGAKVQWHIHTSSSHPKISPIHSTLSEFNNIDISASCANINIIKSDKFALKYYLYYDNAVTKPEYSVSNGKLIFKDNNYINYSNQDTHNNNKNYINIFIPENTHLDVVKLESKIGDVKIDKINCNRCNINLSIGDINISDCQWGESDIFTHTGDINIYGKILGKNQISTNTGDIDISTPLSKNDYSGNIHTTIGSIIKNIDYGTSYNSDESRSNNLILNSNINNILNLSTNVGDINLQFNR